jgi:HAD superfamily hydrolase (TIGR01509 family)
MPVEAVLFDLFDTLLLLESDGAYYEPSLRKMHAFLVKKGVKTSFENFSRVYFKVRDKFYSESRESLEEPHFNVRVYQTLKRLGYDFDFSDPVIAGATAAFAEEFVQHVRLDSDAIDVLQKLYRRYKLGLVSNFGIPECGRRLLVKFGLRRYLDVVVISGEINRRKPSPEVFERALLALGVAASKAVFVGDMMDLDVKGPKAVGIRAILIERRPVEVVLDVKPDRVIRSLAELPAVLENLN